jgi:hypothetical protein
MSEYPFYRCGVFLLTLTAIFNLYNRDYSI